MDLFHLAGLEVTQVVVVVADRLNAEGGQTTRGVATSKAGVWSTWNIVNMYMYNLQWQCKFVLSIHTRTIKSLSLGDIEYFSVYCYTNPAITVF